MHKFEVSIQWRIQDFPERQPQGGSANLLLWPFFPRELHKIKKNGPRALGTRLQCPPGSANVIDKEYFRFL